jgi:type I restriction enzyme S subunit
MNAERLLAHFETISEAPDAIARLRRFILDLAVRGKLVEQDPEDEPAGELLLEFQRKRQKSGLRSAKLCRGSRLSDMAEPGHAIPENWMWAPIGMIFLYDAGIKAESKKLDQDSWLLELEDLEKDTGKLLARSSVGDRMPQSTKTSFQARDILYGKLRPYLNKVFVADQSGYSSTEIVALRAFSDICPEYCALALRRPDFVRYVTLLGQGTKMPRLRTEDAVIAPFPLPPLAEQNRIVAKVDELMALCDQLEAACQERERGRERLVAATLQRLNQPAEDPVSFRRDARFALQVLPSLATTAAQIKQLRQTILNLAVRGRLVEQDPEDEDKRVHSKLIDSADKSFSLIPASWLYVPLASLLDEDTRNGYSRKPDDAEDGFPILRISAGTARPDGLVDEREFKLISGIDDDLASQYAVEKGDLLACRFNGNKAYVGRVSLFTGYSGRKFIYPDKLIRIRLSDWLAEPSFFRWISNSDLVRKEVENRCATTVGNWGISAGKLKTCMFPLPPLAEQHRIVAKVDTLMALCDELEQQLNQADQQRRRLLEALLAEALVGRLSAEEVSHADIA